MTIRPRHTKEDKFKAEAILELEKIKPRQIVLEETDEECCHRQDIVTGETTISIIGNKIWKEVKETTLSLNSDEPKLSLSV